MEEMEVELRATRGRYSGLSEKYDALSRLYMDLLKQKGGRGVEGEAVARAETFEEPILGEWRGEDVELGGGGGVRDGMGMMSYELDVGELLFGGPIATVARNGTARL